MIQRIQTVYLFLSSLITLGLLFTPLANLVSATKEIYKFNAFSISNEVSDTAGLSINAWPIGALIIAISVLFFFSIFLYKKRILQARICMLNIILLLGLAGLIFFYATVAQSELDASITYSVFNITIPVAIILSFISNRRIRLDEALVKSYDRIR